ncbi:MAG: hypothetical protein ACYC8T_37260, partial [Myxococcaceae bacterium]
MTLPPTWKVSFGPAGPGALRLSLGSATPVAGSTSLAFFRKGPELFGRASFPFGPTEIELAFFPTLDELWTLYLLACREAGGALPPSYEAMCQYCEDARQGLWPDRVKPEQAVQALYLALAQGSLLAAPPRRERFLEEAFRFCDAVARHLEAGRRLLDDPLSASEPSLERFGALLASDHALYREDLVRGRRFNAKVPAAASATGAMRALPLLALRRPAATQFKLWARRDPNAPGGSGFPLLLAELADGSVVVSADPAVKVRVGFLAAPLSEREKVARHGAPAPWYDGRDHDGTLAASPKEGTRLLFDQVLAVVGASLELEEVRLGRSRSPRLAAGVALAACLVLSVVGARSLLQAPEAPPAGEGLAIASGAKGDPIPKAGVLNLLGSDDGPRSLTHYALVAGACAYSGARELKSPCRDA